MNMRSHRIRKGLVSCSLLLLLMGMLTACAADEVMNETVSAPTETPVKSVQVQVSPTQPPLPTSTPFPVAQATPKPISSATPVPLATRRPATTPTAVEGLARVEVGEFFVDPPVLTIIAGTTVEWIPRGDREHTIVSKDGNPGWPRDGSVGQIGSPSFRATFHEPGVYEYYCGVHPSVMDGEIIVIEAGGEASP